MEAVADEEMGSMVGWPCGKKHDIDGHRKRSQRSDQHLWAWATQIYDECIEKPLTNSEA